MEKPREDAWTYHIKFTVGTAHYETTVKAYGRDTARKLVEQQHPNCRIEDEDIVMEEKVYYAPSKDDNEKEGSL